MTITKCSLLGCSVLAALLILSGCATQYSYTPPTTAEGRSCALRCQNTQSACRGRQDQHAAVAQNQCQQEAAIAQDQCLRQSSHEHQQCQHDSDVDYTACLKYAHTDADRANCKQKSCPQRDCSASSCYNSANYDLCDNDFRICYQTCGGQVQEVQ